jgi:DNA-binding NarL/FixJ family response regulator
MRTPRIMVVDDNPVVRSGLVSLLEADGMQVVAEAGDGVQAVELAERLRPDLVLLDVRMPLLDGVGAAKKITKRTPVIFVTYADRPEVIRAAIATGAAGYLVHGAFTAEEFVAAVRDALDGANPLSPAAVSVLMGSLRGRPRARASRLARLAGDLPPHQVRFNLSDREVDVMELMTQGRSNAEIAVRLCLAEKTVKNHVNHIFAKLEVGTRAAAIAQWLGTSKRA